MNMVITSIVLPAMAIGCVAAASRFEGESKLFLYGCAALNVAVLVDGACALDAEYAYLASSYNIW